MMDKQVNKLSLPLIIALIGFPQISETIYTPALPSVTSGLNADPHLVEATLAIYLFGFAIGILLWGAVSDVIGRRLSMLGGIVLYAIGTIACGASQTIESLLAWRCIQAIGASVGSVVTMTMLRDTHKSSQLAKLFSVITASLAFSPAFGPVIGGYLSEMVGWRSNFWFLTGVAVVLFFWSIKALPETRPEHIIRPSRAQITALLKKMLSSQSLWGHSLLIGSLNGIIFSFYEEAPFVFIEQLGMSPGHYGCIGLLIAAASLLSGRLSYLLSTSYNAVQMIRLGSCICAVGSVGYILLVASGLFGMSGLGLGLTLSALFTLFLGVWLIIPNSFSIALKSYQTAAGTAGSVFGALYYIFTALFAWIMSGLHDGTAWPLPLYIGALSATVLFASAMVRQGAPAEVAA